MDKNTVWAIALSTIVIGVFLVLQSTVFAPKRQNISANTEQSAAISENALPENSQDAAPVLIASSDTEEAVSEQSLTIVTDKIKAVFTNRGGDIIGYELLNHVDTDTNKGVEMADNISAFNRACAVSFGDANGAMINDLFSVEQPDANTVLFTRRYNGYTFGKRYTFIPGEYMFKLEVLIHSDEGAVSLNTNNAAYTIRTAPQVGPHYNPRINRYDSRMFITFDGNKKKYVQVGTKQFKPNKRDISKNFSFPKNLRR